MAKTILKNVTLLYGAVDVSGDTNQLNTSMEKPTRNVTNFASGGWEEYLLGHGSGQWTFSGFRGEPEPDATLFSNLGSTAVPVTYTLSNPVAAGDISYTGRCVEAGYTIGEPVGEVARFDASFTTSERVLRGKCLDTANAATAAGNGTGLNHGAVLSTQKAFAVLHVLSVTGTSPVMPIKVQSDGDDTWASPTDRITFTNVTDDTATWVQVLDVSGAITDTWWRTVRGTIAGTDTPTFKYRVFFIIA